MAQESLTLTFLGTGTSHGVPVLDCMIADYTHCPRNICKLAYNDPKHRRGRASLLIEYQGAHILIDASADFREQMLREKVPYLDALLITHKHADHIMGIPDTRSYSRLIKGGLPLYGSQESLDAITESFAYIFDPTTFVGGGIPTLTKHEVAQPFVVEGLTFTPLLVTHGSCTGCYGYRFNDIAYIPDVKEIPPTTMALLQGLDLLIIDCLRLTEPHSTHLILPEVLELIEELAPRRVLTTHMTHNIHYGEDKKLVPTNVDFAYDGLRMEL